MTDPTSAFASYLAREFPLASSAACPEIQLHLGLDLAQSWSLMESYSRRALPPPYWSVAWPGGLALARLVLDNPDLVRGRRVLDLGSGSGLCAIAAALAGAGTVVAADVDDVACMAAAINARNNGVAIEVVCADLIGRTGAVPWDVVLGADLWYERFFAQRVNAWLGQLAMAGVDVLMGDPGRAHLPRAGLVQLGTCDVPCPEGLERQAVIRAFAYRLTSSAGCLDDRGPRAPAMRGLHAKAFSQSSKL